jgi:hypothetical protein
MSNRQTLRAVSSTLVFMLGTIVGALIGHAEMDSLFDHRHLLVILTASAVFFLTNYVPFAIIKFRQ